MLSTVNVELFYNDSGDCQTSAGVISAYLSVLVEMYMWVVLKPLLNHPGLVPHKDFISLTLKPLGTTHGLYELTSPNEVTVHIVHPASIG